MDDLKIQKLHAELALINNKYESIAKATGSNYNIFQVLKIETKEVTTHSRMIADLLNPRGSHGMGSQFLILFLESIEMAIPSNPEDVICTVEKNYGPIDHQNIKGGSIDIILENGFDKPLAIENKIYAGDQDKQLLRYYNQLNGNCDLFYLTLFGKTPTDQSTGGESLNIKCISYNGHILKWFKDCHELSIDRPLLRETLKQYINIIKHLTGQSMNDDKNKEIFDFIEKNKDSLKDLYIPMNSFVNNHLEKLVQKVFGEIVKDQPLIKLLAEEPTLIKHEGHLVCHFKFGNKEKGVIFELKTFPNELSLWTTAWRWEENISYGEDPSLIEALKVKGRYNAPLNSSKSVKELAKEVIEGIKATKIYYGTLK